MTVEPKKQQLAVIYGTSERQIARWERLDAPLEDVREMLKFLRRGRNPATATLKKIKAHADEMQRSIDELMGAEQPAVVESNEREQGDAQSTYIDEDDLRLQERKLNLERARHKLECERREVLPVTQFQAALSATITAFNQALTQLSGRCSQKLATQMRAKVLDALSARLTPNQLAKASEALEALDYAEVEETLNLEIEIVRATLAQCDYLKSDAISGT